MMITIRGHKLNIPLPYLSDDWTAGSTGGGGASIGTPEVKIALDIGYLRLPLNHLTRGKVDKTYRLQGVGAGVGASIGLTIPFVNGNGSGDDFPGQGSSIMLSPLAPRHPALAEFCHYVTVMSVSGGSDVQGSAGLVVFSLEPPLGSSGMAMMPGIGPAMAAAQWAYSIRGASVCAGLNLATSIGSVGCDFVCYKVWAHDDQNRIVS